MKNQKEINMYKKKYNQNQSHKNEDLDVGIYKILNYKGDIKNKHSKNFFIINILNKNF